MPQALDLELPDMHVAERSTRAADTRAG
jgi:hypothetical protein